MLIWSTKGVILLGQYSHLTLRRDAVDMVRIFSQTLQSRNPVIRGRFAVLSKGNFRYGLWSYLVAGFLCAKNQIICFQIIRCLTKIGRNSWTQFQQIKLVHLVVTKNI